jgi:hypothetical protein
MLADGKQMAIAAAHARRDDNATALQQIANFGGCAKQHQSSFEVLFTREHGFTLLRG